MLFGDEIKRIRTEELRITLDELSEKSGLSKGFLSKLENNKQDISRVENIQKLANGLDVNYFELLYKAGYIDKKTYEESTTSYGENLKKIRQEKKITLDELANKSGIDKEYISRLEEERKDVPDHKTTAKLATALEVVSKELSYYSWGFQQAKDNSINSEDDLKKTPKTRTIHLLDKILNGDHNVEYNKKELTTDQKESIVKFIETFVINKNKE